MACDSISINLFKLLVTALELNAPRKKVVIERGQFPTDGYVAHGLSNLLGEDRIRIVSVDRDDLVTAMDDETAIVLLSHVHYVTSEKYDLADWTERAHAVGALVIWDLAHSAGVEPLKVSDAKVDFATGCTYKFLCGGPGDLALFMSPSGGLAKPSSPSGGGWAIARRLSFPRPTRALMISGNFLQEHHLLLLWQPRSRRCRYFSI